MEIAELEEVNMNLALWLMETFTGQNEHFSCESEFNETMLLTSLKETIGAEVSGQNPNFDFEDDEAFMFNAFAFFVSEIFVVLKEKNNTDGIVDIMVKAEDASKISRMVDKFDLATIDTKAIRESVLSQQKIKDAKPLSDEEHDALLSKLMDEKSNPNKARTSKDGTPFEPSSKTLKRENKKKTVERKKSTVTMDRPSVRQELKDIKQEQLKSSAPKYPVRKKSKKKVR